MVSEDLQISISMPTLRHRFPNMPSPVLGSLRMPPPQDRQFMDVGIFLLDFYMRRQATGNGSIEICWWKNYYGGSRRTGNGISWPYHRRQRSISRWIVVYHPSNPKPHSIKWEKKFSSCRTHQAAKGQQASKERRKNK